jgi:hypothetical protein
VLNINEKLCELIKKEKMSYITPAEFWAPAPPPQPFGSQPFQPQPFQPTGRLPPHTARVRIDGYETTPAYQKWLADSAPGTHHGSIPRFEAGLPPTPFPLPQPGFTRNGTPFSTEQHAINEYYRKRSELMQNNQLDPQDRLNQLIQLQQTRHF